MFDEDSNVQLAGRLLKLYYPKLIVMRGVEHIVSLFFNDASKKSIVNQIMFARKTIYNILVLVYITSHIPFINQNLKSITIKTFVFFAEMKLGWMDIS